jgi:hypothetical protein
MVALVGICHKKVCGFKTNAEGSSVILGDNCQKLCERSKKFLNGKKSASLSGGAYR